MNIKEIEGFPDYYVTGCGDIYSSKRGWKKRKLTPDKDGYLTIVVSPDGGITRKTLKVHRVVAQHFVTNQIDGLEVNHIDGDKTNNHYSNLEVTCHRKNMQHARDTGLLCRGTDKPDNKYSEDQIRHVCQLIQDTDLYLRTVSEITGVSEAICRSIYYGQKWQFIAKDYVFDKAKRPRGRGTLSKEQVVEICQRHMEGMTNVAIAELMGVTYSKVQKVTSGKSYVKISSQYLHKTPKTIESTSSDGSE